MKIKNNKQLNQYIFRFFPQLPEGTFYAERIGKRYMLFISTPEGKLVYGLIYHGSWVSMNRDEATFDKFTDDVLKLVNQAGYY